MTCTRTNSSQSLIPWVFLLSKVASEPGKRYQQLQRFKAKIELSQDSYNMERRILTGIGMFIGNNCSLFFHDFLGLGPRIIANVNQFDQNMAQQKLVFSCFFNHPDALEQCVFFTRQWRRPQRRNTREWSGEHRGAKNLLLLRKALFLKKTSPGYRFEQMIMKEEYFEVFCFLLVQSVDGCVIIFSFYIMLCHVLSFYIIVSWARSNKKETFRKETSMPTSACSILFI